jgi:GNAT superfamily N-acetyltransferase
MQIVAAHARETDAAAVAALRTAAGAGLTAAYGQGHWTINVTIKGVEWDLRRGQVIVARDSERIVGTLSLGTRKPWAIDASCFPPVKRPLYLTNMAVAPDMQARGVGRFLLSRAWEAAVDWPAGAIRLDAYEGAMGAGGFYTRCGYREVGRAIYRDVPLIYYEQSLGPAT